MGDIADYLIDQYTGENSVPDPAKECKFCGAYPLFWLNKKDKWVLIDQKGNEHKCKNRKTEDVFHGK